MIRSILWALILVSACSAQPKTASENSSARPIGPPNILLIIADDMGAETLSCYELSSDTAHTPNLDQLCSESARFTMAWSQPVCSPTRAGILTGRHGFRTGTLGPIGVVGSPKRVEDGYQMFSASELIVDLIARGEFALPSDAPISNKAGAPPPGLKVGQGPRLEEVTIAHTLQREAQYQTAAIGKWHLSDDANGGAYHPNLAGFDYYKGPLHGGVSNYYDFAKWENGVLVERSQTYATTDTVNDALSWINETSATSPWFVWLAFNAPHDPFHKPPNELISLERQILDPNGIEPENAIEYYRAMIEALDFEIGRLISNLPEDEDRETVILFVGDNGTPIGLVGDPYTNRAQGKGTVFQAGIHVPLMISGKDYMPGPRDSLAHTTDLFATILDIAGIDLTKLEAETLIDSRSLLPVLNDAAHDKMDFNYAELKALLPIGRQDQQIARNSRYKLLLDHISGDEFLYDLVSDPTELNALNLESLSEEEQAALTELRLQLDPLSQ